MSLIANAVEEESQKQKRRNECFSVAEVLGTKAAILPNSTTPIHCCDLFSASILRSRIIYSDDVGSNLARLLVSSDDFYTQTCPRDRG